MPAVLFVCLGNICRSPAAEGLLKKIAEERCFGNLLVDSCGLGDWHEGQLADERMREAAQKRGVVISNRARQITPLDFETFDFLFAASHEVLKHLMAHAKTPEQKSKVKLITAFSKGYPNQDIPDPYYKGAAEFDLVLDMLDDSCHGILDHILI